MQVDLAVLFQVMLIILVVAVVVAVILLVIILLDIRQVTRKIRQAVSTVNLIGCLFDSDDCKSFIQKLRKTGLGWLEKLFNAVRKVAGGGKNG